MKLLDKSYDNQIRELTLLVDDLKAKLETDEKFQQRIYRFCTKEHTPLNALYNRMSIVARQTAQLITQYRREIDYLREAKRLANPLDEVVSIKMRRGFILDIRMLCKMKIKQVSEQSGLKDDEGGDSVNCLLQWLQSIETRLKSIKITAKSVGTNEMAIFEITRGTLLACKMLCEMKINKILTDSNECGDIDQVQHLLDEINVHKHLLD